MERITPSMARSAFARLLTVMGERPATAYSDVGGWRLDKGLGGFVVEQIGGETGWARRPLDDRRRSSRELYDACWFAIRAIEAMGANRD